MSQDGFSITTTPPLSGLALVNAINAALQALASQSSGSTEPSTTYAYQFWFDTTLGILKQRDAGNTTWIPLAAVVSGAFRPYINGVAIASLAGASPLTIADSSGALTVQFVSAIAGKQYLGLPWSDKRAVATLPATVATADHGKLVLVAAASGTLTLSDATVAGINVLIRADGGGAITLSRAGTDKIVSPSASEVNTLSLPAGAAVWLSTGDGIGKHHIVGYYPGPGTSGQVLKSAGADTLPVWTTQIAAANLPAGAIVDRAYAEYGTNGEITTHLAFNSTPPTISDGTEILSAALTPKAATNRFRVSVGIIGAVGNPDEIIVMAVFDGSTLKRVGWSSEGRGGGGSGIVSGFLIFEYVPGDTSAHTISVRIGGTASTIRTNALSVTAEYGGNQKCTLVVEEIAAS